MMHGQQNVKKNSYWLLEDLDKTTVYCILGFHASAEVASRNPLCSSASSNGALTPEYKEVRISTNPELLLL